MQAVFDKDVADVGESNILLASWIVRDTIAGRKPRKVSSHRQSKAYDLYHSTPFRLVQYAVVIAHWGMAFWESRSMNWQSQGQSCLFNGPGVQRQRTSIHIDAGFLLFYVISLAIKGFGKGWHNIFKNWWTRVEYLCVLVMFIDYVLAVTGASLRGGDGEAVRFGVPFRGMLLVAISPNLRKHVLDLARTMQSIKYLATLVGLWLVVCSIMVVLYVRAICPACDSGRESTCITIYREQCKSILEAFDTSSNALVALFVLLTSENFASLLPAFFEVSPWTIVFFIVYIVVGVYLLMSVLLAVIFEGYKRAKAIEVRSELDRTDSSLLKAFKLLSDPQKSVIYFPTYKRFMSSLVPGIKPEAIRLYWMYLDDDYNGFLDAFEFIELTSIMGVRLKKQRQSSLNKFFRSKGKFGLGIPRVRGIIEHRWFALATEMVLVANILAMFVSTALMSFDRQENCMSLSGHAKQACLTQEVLENFEHAFFAWYALELAIKVAAYGLSSVIRPWMWLDFLVVMLGVAFYFLRLVQVVFVRPGMSSIIRLFRVVRVLKLFFVEGKFRALLRTFLHILPGLSSFMVLLICIVFTFSAIAFEAFQCRVVNPDSELIDFDSMTGTFVWMMQIVVTSDWDNVMNYSMEQVSGWSALFFCTFFSLVVLVLTNLMASLIIEAYSMNIEASNSKKSIQNVFTFDKSKQVAHPGNGTGKDGTASAVAGGDYVLSLRQNSEKALALRLASFDPKQHREEQHRLARMEAEAGVSLLDLKEQKSKAQEKVSVLKNVFKATNAFKLGGAGATALGSLDTHLQEYQKWHSTGATSPIRKRGNSKTSQRDATSPTILPSESQQQSESNLKKVLSHSQAGSTSRHRSLTASSTASSVLSGISGTGQETYREVDQDAIIGRITSAGSAPVQKALTRLCELVWSGPLRQTSNNALEVTEYLDHLRSAIWMCQELGEQPNTEPLLSAYARLEGLGMHVADENPDFLIEGVGMDLFSDEFNAHNDSFGFGLDDVKLAEGTSITPNGKASNRNFFKDGAEDSDDSDMDVEEMVLRAAWSAAPDRAEKLDSGTSGMAFVPGVGFEEDSTDSSTSISRTARDKSAAVLSISGSESDDSDNEHYNQVMAEFNSRFGIV